MERWVWVCFIAFLLFNKTSLAWATSLVKELLANDTHQLSTYIDCVIGLRLPCCIFERVLKGEPACVFEGKVCGRGHLPVDYNVPSDILEDDLFYVHPYDVRITDPVVSLMR